MKTERLPITMKRHGSMLIPISGFDEGLLHALPEDAAMEITVNRRRSLPQLRMYWSILHRVVEATGSHPTPEHLHSAIKLALGYATDVTKLDGEIIRIPDSVAFDKMDATAFRDFFERAIELLNKLTGSDVLQEAA
jgi:hypothetical protein